MLGYDPTIDPYYAPAQYAFTRQPLNYHLYTLPRPEALAHRYFISDDVREELTRRVETTRTVAPPGLNLPEDLQGYHSLMPLEPVNTGDTRRQFGNWYSTVYRAVNSKDGAPYALRRIEGFRLMQQSAFAAIEAWSRIHHPNIVSVREAFTTRAFSDSSLVVVHDYHPNARTLYDAHLRSVPPEFVGGRLQGPQIPQAGDIPERTMWSYIIQIANAIRAVHDAGLAVRIVDVTKVIITGKNSPVRLSLSTERTMVRLSSCGIVDVLMHEARADVAYLQQEDLAMFGKLIFQLGCGKMHALTNLPKAMEAMSHFYSADLQKVALLLVGKPEPRKNIGQVFDMIGNRLLAEMDEMQNAADRLEGELMSELENGRLVRLLCKFGFINERPEFAREPRWSETGDRYIIKLFRDYVFHQVDEHGNPVVNLTHVLTCLNKLDAGTDERIMLVSRDEQSCLVVSYKDIKTCIDSAFRCVVLISSRSMGWSHYATVSCRDGDGVGQRTSLRK
ncbi:hypothetical protein OBBRIDRAFT_728936 [Obba rivulosa]|uniref:PAN2-PAN3 deadenylation complex subunit PAN3 n=1 Tax=Obba rivulosa TaxID=1052685 RepID=A0A8E2B345_9APHY|nr:hypothetical protein OBBRIDRAFT_728936 [Obba rivulosa]